MTPPGQGGICRPRARDDAGGGDANCDRTRSGDAAAPARIPIGWQVSNDAFHESSLAGPNVAPRVPSTCRRDNLCPGTWRRAPMHSAIDGMATACDRYRGRYGQEVMRPLLATAIRRGIGHVGASGHLRHCADAYVLATFASVLVDGVTYDTVSSIVPLALFRLPEPSFRALLSIPSGSVPRAKSRSGSTVSKLEPSLRALMSGASVAAS